MSMQVYTVVDKEAEVAGPPFLAKNDKVAWRKFSSFMVENKLDYEVFQLKHICEWKEEEGSFGRLDEYNVKPSVSIVEDDVDG